jgi:hypothetical protein
MHTDDKKENLTADLRGLTRMGDFGQRFQQWMGCYSRKFHDSDAAARFYLGVPLCPLWLRVSLAPTLAFLLRAI